MFYMNSCTHVSLRPVPVTKATLSGSASELNTAFSEVRGMPDLLTSNVGSIAGIGRVLDGIEIDNALRNRLLPAEASGILNTTGLSDSMNHSAVLQNTYMNHNAGSIASEDYTDDTNNSGIAEKTPFAPYVIAPLDASVIVDPVELPFNPLLDISMKITPEVTSDAGQLTLPSLASLIESRIRDAASDYNIGYSGNASSQGGSLIGTARGSTDNPHMIDRMGYVERSNPWLLYLMSTDLEVDDYSKIARLIGTTYIPINTPVSYPYNSQLLKFTIYPMQELNPNGMCLVAFSRVGSWHSPIVGFLSNNRVKTPGVSQAIGGPVIAPSCQIYGFADNASSKITTTAVTRSPRTVADVIRVDQPGVTGVSTYYVERYQRDLIHTVLTSHLPRKNPDGSKSTYFELGTFLTKAGSDIEANFECGSSQFCLQPVAFAMAQQPEDIWLYYVSMDDNLVYWLNRQELGKAHDSEPLIGLSKPPLQMEVFNGSLWMLHETRIDVYNIATKALVTYGSSSSIPSGLRSLAVDRELSRMYVGHASGVFDFTDKTFTPVAMPQAKPEYLRVATCKLTAVNGFLTWVTNPIEDRISTANRPPNWVVRHEVAVGRTIALSYAMISSTTRMTDSIIASSIRSNGDLLVLHTGTFGSTPPSLSWLAFDEEGMMHRKSVRHYFGFWQDTYGSDFRLMSRMFRIDDLHYSVLTLPVWLVQRTLDGTLGLFTSTDNGMSQPWTGDFRLDDSNCRIYFYPLPKTNRMSSRKASGTAAARYYTPYTPIPFASVYVRACDYEYAKHSATVVILDKCYSLFVCGIQLPTSIGIELDWNGTDWVHGVAGKVNRSRKTHSSSEFINEWTKISFASGQMFDTYTAYQIKTYPSTTMQPCAVSYYAGDLIPTSTTITVVGTETTIPDDINSPSYCGIEYERSDLMTCVVGESTLVYQSGTTPDETHFSVKKNTVYLHSTHIGKSMTFHYSYVKAVSP